MKPGITVKFSDFIICNMVYIHPIHVNDTHDLAQRLSYSSWRRHQMPVSLRPLGARSSH